MKFLILLVFVFSLSNAAITLKNVYFDDYEQNASTHLITYYPYQDFINMAISATNTNRILTCRNNNNPTLTCVSNAGLTTADLRRIREKSHIIDWNLYTDSLGLTLHQTNFLYGLSGLLIGFVFMLAFILIVSRK